MRKQKHGMSRIAVIGNHLPRQCGIATFTTDLCEALASQYKDSDCFAVPVNDREEGYAYPSRVRFEIAEEDLTSYVKAADFLNAGSVDLVCLQHEFGIFGGPYGNHILALLRHVRTPVVTTLHTILQEPETQQRAVFSELAHLSDRLVVLSRRSQKDLHEIYGIPAEKIEFIPHGIPDVPFVDPNYYKDLFHVEGKMVLLTFGLLSSNKGIENVIAALPEILKSHPDVMYLVLGATHPHVKRREGEVYRDSLKRLAENLGVQKNVIFYDRFVSLEQLVQFIGAADIYITPYLNPKQSVSGTLAYTLGAGKAVISTPYEYADELLAGGRGMLVPFRDPRAVGSAVTELLDNPSKCHAMRKNAYEFGRDMIWPKVARRYMETFRQAREERARRPRVVSGRKPVDKITGVLPPLNLNHLRRLTDRTGILQHAVYSVPNFSEGYAADDNARALILAARLETRLAEDSLYSEEIFSLAGRYLAFLEYAFNPEARRFKNFLSYDRRWLEEIGSEDSHGRALWALGTVLGTSKHPGLRGCAHRLFQGALPAAKELASLRAWAFSIFGIVEYLKAFPGDRAARQMQKLLARRLRDAFRSAAKPDWPWFEDTLTYSNAALPHALLLCGETLDRQDLTDLSLKTLEWLTQVQKSEEGHFVPVGSNGFYPRGKEKARFDQQPVESDATVSACLDACRITKNAAWAGEARRAFEWFIGRNDLGLSLYDPSTGGCRDGLHSDRVNENQGAESTLCFLLSSAQMRAFQRENLPDLKQLAGIIS